MKRSKDGRKAFRFDQREVTMLKMAASDHRNHCTQQALLATTSDADREAWLAQAEVMHLILMELYGRR